MKRRPILRSTVYPSARRSRRYYADLEQADMELKAKLDRERTAAAAGAQAELQTDTTGEKQNG